MTKDYNILEEFCVSFCKIIDKYTDYIVVSGFFVISSGRSRATEDIDIIIKPLDLDKFILMHKDLEKANFECLQDSNPNKIYTNYLIKNIAVRYFRGTDFIPNIELKFAKDELDYYQLKNRKKIEFTDIDVFFSSVEACIAFKEELLQSPKDIEDANYLKVVYSDYIIKDEIIKIKKMIKKYRLR